MINIFKKSCEDSNSLQLEEVINYMYNKLKNMQYGKY